MSHGPVEAAALAEVVPPRALEASMSAARGLVATVATGSVSLEIAVTARGPRWHVRAQSADELERALAQARTSYPQCAVEHVDADDDPIRMRGEEYAAAIELRPRAEGDLPLRTDWRNEHDPLTGILTAASISAGERVVVRLALAPSSERRSADIRRRAEPARWSRNESSNRSGPSPVPLLALMVLGAGVQQGWRWYEAREWGYLGLSAGGFLIAAVLSAAIWTRFFRRPASLPTTLVDRKLTGPLLAGRLEVCVFADDRERADILVRQVAAAYAAYDDPAGGGLRGQNPHRLATGAGRFPLCLNTAEAAALWHLPEEEAAPARVRRTTARRLAPAPGHAASGVRVGVGDANDDDDTIVHLPTPLLHRNHLIVAKTRRGKSTLLRHLASGVMERIADGSDETALVVVDPHQDLAEAVLGSIPDALVDRTVYLDFANLDRPVGLNLIDVELFPDRDRTTEHIVTMLNRLWPQNWGPRMEGALRASLATLHELNGKRDRDEQYTLLDVAPLLTDSQLRKRLLLDVDDPALAAWWRDNYDRAGRTLQQQTANPVTSKIGRFTVTEASRLVLGQARSTFDPRAIIRDGGVLVVNTAVGTLGEGAASLVGATLLNLLGLLVEEQVALPAAERRRVVQLVDESSTLGAVDYPRMLSELGKYGASFVLVTQSLAKLDAIDRNLAPTIFANSDGLTAFQVSAEDARRLTPELGSGIEVEDLVSLDDFTCYARWWDGRTRPASFSFRVDPPPPDASERALAIAQASAAKHGRPRDEVVEEVMRALAERSPLIQPRERIPSPVTASTPAAGNATGRPNTPIDGTHAPPAARGEGTTRERRDEEGTGGMTTPFTEHQLIEALAWIVRLPLLGDIELARLLGMHEIEARHLREELARRGWIDWTRPGVPELSGDRHAAFLRIGALADLAAWSGFGTEEIARRAPACDGALLHRVPRIGIVSGVNWLVANLAAELRERGAFVLTDACSLPVAAGHWWPRGVDAYAAVGGGRGTAPFFVAWDRTGAPDGRRRQRIADWATASAASTEAPPIFVACADQQAQRVWEDAIRQCHERSASVPHVLFTTVPELVAIGPRAVMWSTAGASASIRFEQALAWRAEDAGPLLAFGRSTPLPHRAPSLPRFRTWAGDAAALAGDAPIRKRLAALAAATSAADKLCLDLLARHPRLSASELAVHLDLPVAVVARRLASLLRLHAVRQLAIDGVTLWCITPRALRLLASAEDAPWRRTKRPAGAFSAPAPEDDLQTHPSIAHQLGINHVFTQFAADARNAKWRLRAWRNEAESAFAFQCEGRRTSIRPDGSGTLSCGGQERSFLLEYDRGTLDGGDFAKKFGACRRYYETEAWRSTFDTEPLLLFVCSDARAERRVVAAARHAAISLPFAATTEWRFLRDPTNPAGLFGPIWRDVDDRRDRVPLTSLWSRRIHPPGSPGITLIESMDGRQPERRGEVAGWRS